MKNTKGKGLSLRVICPYCTREIEAGANKCQECGSTFGTDTMKIIRSLIDKPDSREKEKRQQKDRIPKKFKISFPSPDTFKEQYLANVGTGGIFIQTRKPLNRGARFDLRIYLPDGQNPVDVYCEVVWAHNLARVVGTKSYPPGMGIKFLDLSVEGRERIDDILCKA